MQLRLRLTRTVLCSVWARAAVVSTGNTGAGEVEKAAAVVAVALAAAAGVARGSSSSSTTWIRGRAGGIEVRAVTEKLPDTRVTE